MANEPENELSDYPEVEEQVKNAEKSELEFLLDDHGSLEIMKDQHIYTRKNLLEIQKASWERDNIRKHDLTRFPYYVVRILKEDASYEGAHNILNALYKIINMYQPHNLGIRIENI